MWTDALDGFTGLVMRRRDGAAAQAWDLATDRTLRLVPPRRGMVLTVASGSVLVTQEGDPEDHVLGAGEQVWLARRRVVVAWALAASRVAVVERR
jgi:Protein of unknown function (DUF2917)